MIDKIKLIKPDGTPLKPSGDIVQPEPNLYKGDTAIVDSSGEPLVGGTADKTIIIPTPSVPEPKKIILP